MTDMIYMTEKWKCPRCSFPENFTPTCALCAYHNPKVERERPETAEKYRHDR